MPAPILATKLFVPPPPPQVVSRPRLIERLNENLRVSAGFVQSQCIVQSLGFAKKLTLISAPAGFGKTTLVAEWCDAHKERIAWLSLEEGDSDPTRFLIYLISALQTMAPPLGAGILNLLESSQPPPIEPILTALVNELSTLPDHIVLVLDDYHVIDSGAVDDALTFLLEHLPPQLHLVITTREDPRLPLPRLRVRGQLTELRAADLRFTPSEAAEFLNSVMGLALSPEQITGLEDRTEGWIAGLQLAALSMQGRRDVSGFLQAFAGDHRYIVDYLVQEVLERQPEQLRNFLLQTAVLDRLNGSLCDAITGQKESKTRLKTLQRGNFFLIPLDDKRHWYRYHHLFADVLAMHLMAEQPEQVPLLHRRASEWYEQNGSVEEAIRHALAAEDFERAADLIERALPQTRRSREDAMRLGWLKALPDKVLYHRPVLSLAYAHMLLVGGGLEGVEELLQDSEQWLETGAGVRARPHSPPADTHSEPGQAMVVVDEEAFRSLPGAIAIARAGLALAQGDIPESKRYARQALDIAAEEDHITRGGAAGFLGLAAWSSGDLEQAHRMYAEGMASLQKAGNIADAINGAVTLGGIRIAQGRLREAMRTYERGLQLAEEYGMAEIAVRGIADMYVGMSELEYEHNALQVAVQHLLTSKELGELAGFQQNRYRWQLAMARIRQAEGDFEGALGLLHEAKRLYMRDFSPNVRPIAALEARVWIAQDKLGQVLAWARERGLSAGDELDYDREFEHMTIARMLLAQYRSERSGSSIRDAIGLLERLQKAAEQGGRMGNVIEILVLQALAHHARGELAAALPPLERALALAEPEGYVRIFLDEGESMAQILRHAAHARKTLPNFAGEMLAVFQTEQTTSAAKPSPPIPSALRALPEPLTERELEILRLFKTELTGPEIASKLVIALSTLRTHTKNIYSKLDVKSRRAAVNRAQELGLI